MAYVRKTTNKKQVRYSDEVAEEICLRLAEGEHLCEICNEENMPSRVTVFQWTRNKPEFAAKYRQARLDKVETWMDEIITIADDGRNDWMEKKKRNGEIEVVFDKENYGRSRLRIETRLRLAGKIASHLYGERLQTDVNIQNRTTIRVVLEDRTAQPEGALDVVRDRISNS